MLELIAGAECYYCRSKRERQIFLPLAMLLLGLPRTVVRGVVDAFTIQASIMMSTMIAIIVSVS